MTTPKPMSKERRMEIADKYNQAWIPHGMTHTTDMGAAIQELLADAAFWRDAVKSCDESYNLSGVYPGIESCVFCHESENHKPDCPWVLAQS